MHKLHPMRPLRWLRTLGQGALDLLYPPACAACGRALEQASHRRSMPLCEHCWLAIPVVGANVCLRCGMPQGPHVGTVHRCAACPTDLGGIRETVALGRYVHPEPAPLDDDDDGGDDPAAQPEDDDGREHPSEAGTTEDFPAQGLHSGSELLRAMVLKLKYRRGLESARVLGALLATETASRPWAAELDWVVPVPLHWRRQLERRYNQADLIAGELAKRLGLIKLSLLARTRYTASQTTLPRHARGSNVAEAFGVIPRWRRWLLACNDFDQRRVLLIDDLLTTGATLRNCARALRQAGIPTVYAAVVARA